MGKIISKTTIAIIGAGTMGTGIAQLAAMHGHPTLLYDLDNIQAHAARKTITKRFQRMLDKNLMQESQMNDSLERLSVVPNLAACSDAYLIIEAVVESIKVKQSLYASLENIVSEDCIISSNTSTLPITSLAHFVKYPQRILGIHFFNPAPVMQLVEIIPGILTSKNTTATAKLLLESWGKTTIIAKDSPGFIVNRIARPYYSEALRILEENIADVATIDWAMTHFGKFKMGPFRLMDLIGIDVNYSVAKSLFEAFYFDSRYQPSIMQKQMIDAKLLGKKTNHGFYDYQKDTAIPEAKQNELLGKRIFDRIITMLINGAIEALRLGIASRDDIDLAMTTGVNYPKGLLIWADEIGLQYINSQLESLQKEYGEERYRPSPLLKQMLRKNESFYGR